MRKSLDHLPEQKRAELMLVQRVVLDGFARALTQRPNIDRGEILKIILFGSYARGDWIEDRRNHYYSDYDLLVVVNAEPFTRMVDYWLETEAALLAERSLSAPVTLIVHHLADVNEQLELGRYFFKDIVKDGVLLYEVPGHPLGQPKMPPPEIVKAEAQQYFDQLFDTAAAAFRTYELQRGEGDTPRWHNEAAFSLHQATERLYHCVLLTLKLYTPKLHDLDKLRPLAEGLAPKLIDAWPRDTNFSRITFDLLRRAYVDARYSPTYKITAEELDWLAKRITHLRDLVEQICRTHLARSPEDLHRRHFGGGFNPQGRWADEG